MNATVYPIPSREERYHMALGGSPETWAAIAQVEQASRHFDRACNAALARDDDAFTREMAEFNRIKATWAIAASGTVAGPASPGADVSLVSAIRGPSTIAKGERPCL